jgi:hypothetical protein
MRQRNIRAWSEKRTSRRIAYVASASLATALLKAIFAAPGVGAVGRIHAIPADTPGASPGAGTPTTSTSPATTPSGAPTVGVTQTQATQPAQPWRMFRRQYEHHL